MYNKLSNSEIMALGWLYSKIEDVIGEDYDVNRLLYKKACETPVRAISLALKSMPRVTSSNADQMREITECISKLKSLISTLNFSTEFLGLSESQQMIWEIGYFSAKNGDPMPELSYLSDDEVEQDNFRNLIIDFRKTHNLSQSSMAEILQIDRAQLSRWETGQVIPYNTSRQKAIKAMQKYDSSYDFSLIYTEKVYINKENFDEYLNMDPSDFINFLNEFRISRGISQTELANIIDIQRSNFSRMENKRVTPTKETIKKILNKLIEYQEKEDSGQLE